MIDKRVLLTVTVCFGIFFFWNTFVAPPPKPKKAPAAKAQAASVPVAASLEAAAPAVIAAAPPVKYGRMQDDKRIAEVKTTGAALTQLTLKDYKEGGITRGQEKYPVRLVADFAGEPMDGVEFLVDGQAFPFAALESAGQSATLQGVAGDLAANATWSLEPMPYVMRLYVEIQNNGAVAKPVSAALRISGVFNERTLKDKGVFEPPPDLATALSYTDDKLFKHEHGKVDAPPHNATPAWAGIDRQYFLLAAAPIDAPNAMVRFEEQKAPNDPMIWRVSALVEDGPRSLAPGQKAKYSYRIFGGPKAAKLLAAPNQGFEEAIDYKVWFMPLGFLSRPMLWILNQAYSVVHSYGLAILLLTLIVKLIMLPVTQKSFTSMQLMKDLKPELDKIKERFPNDREKQGMETMKLYKERGISPFGGCLPALLQMPVYFALWRTLYAAVELYQQEFLWLGDLTAKDPYYILPLLLGVTFFFQQKVSPPAGDPQQAKIMLYIMPPLMTLFMIQLSSGLVFYVLVNTILTIAQQAYISRKFGKSPTLTPAPKAAR